MKFGNWNVSDKGIDWQSEGFNRFSIELSQLTETERPDGDTEMYKWIVLATDEDWLTVDDLYDLNFAFVYACAGNDIEFVYEIFDKTLAYQFDLLDGEDSDQPEFETDTEESDLEQQRKDAFTERD